MKKVGIFGGTFNPPHNGHLIVAKSVYNQLKLDELIFVPSYISPFKNNGEEVNAIHRYEMLKIIMGENKNFIISDYEINKKGVSYTIDTLKYFKNNIKNAELFLIIGADSFNEIEKWKDFSEYVEYCKIVAMNRENTKIINKNNLDVIQINVPRIPISSSMIREKISKNESIKDFVEENVLTYINSNNLYK